MVRIYEPLPLRDDYTIDVGNWIERLPVSEDSVKLINTACQFASVIGEDHLTRYGISCFAKGLETAEILANLQFDPESIAAAIVYSVAEETDLEIEDIETSLGQHIAQLVKNTHLLSVMAQLKQRRYSQKQINNIRKMLLAMVRDVRVVVIKLAECLCVMRKLRDQDQSFATTIARETMDIFAPLANRLGLYQIKWELEDLAFRHLDPEGYKEIARNLSERRCTREKRVEHIIEVLTNALKRAGIPAEVHGRPKHIYSIKRKMQQKHLDLSRIYDVIAVRILVSTIDDCYAALSVVHECFQFIPEEFDDYIATPKPNGYQSIHTAMFDENHKTFEVQIRTHKMHEVSEKGVAAHWMYKEGKQEKSSYEQKIILLRNLLEWQKELTHDQLLPQTLEKDLFEDRVYVFTPVGDIVDLINGATPLDFAYYIHTELGHRCRGAKVHGKIVPLTYRLETGDQVEVLTSKTNNPSRDWLLPQRGYLKTSTARAKVLQWFHQQDHSKYVAEGKALIERELQRLNLVNISLNTIATKLKFRSPEMMYAALGKGNFRFAQILNILSSQSKPASFEPMIVVQSSEQSDSKGGGDVIISGVGYLLSHIAKCCKPIPGDPIIGYITKTKGITIHHRDCKNIINTDQEHQNRFVEVTWREQTKKIYFVDIEILAVDRPVLIREIMTVFSNHKIDITNFNTFPNKKTDGLKIIITVAIRDFLLLNKIIDHMGQISDVHSVRRLKIS